MGEGGVSSEEELGQMIERPLSPEERIANAERLSKELVEILSKLPQYQEAEITAKNPPDVLARTFKIGGDTYTVADFTNSMAIPRGGFSISRYPEGQKGVEVATWGKGGVGHHPGSKERPQIIYEEFGDVSQYQRRVTIRDTDVALTRVETVVDKLGSAVPAIQTSQPTA